MKANKSNVATVFDEGVLARRKTSFLPDGSYLFEDVLEIKGVLSARVITCTAWLLELYELSSGEVFFVSGEKRIAAQTSVFGVLYPPFTISAPGFKHVKGRLVGLAGTHALPAEFTSAPTLFHTDFTTVPTGFEELIEILRSAAHRQPVAANPSPSLLSLRAKRLIDANHRGYPSMARIAQRLRVSPEHLSRQFKVDFGMSPSGYLHQLRLADAPLRLARGEEIVDVSENVGYNDLSRFYKQFRKSTKTSPGACRNVMKPKRD